MDTYKVAELKPDTVFQADIMLDKLFLVCPATCSLSEDVINALKEWNFATLSSDGTTLLNAVAAAAPAGETQKVSQKEKDEKKKKVLSAQTEDVTNLVKSAGEGSVNKEIQAVLDEVKKENDGSEKAKLAAVEKVYNAYVQYIESVFTHYVTHKDFNAQEISQTMKELCTFIKDHRRYILRIQPSQSEHNRRFLVYHSMRTTVLAIAIGLQLSMPLNKLVELGTTSLLHEIGMLRLPSQVYMNTKPLSNAEKTQMLTHPIISYNILKESGFPLNIQLGALDHHERENGTGYPRHSMGKNISLYGKILAVACSYEAITAPREYKEASTTYEGMIELLRNENHQYDDTVIRALLFSLSLYPIGSYVYLSNGKVGQVVDVNPSDPKNPLVQVIGESAGGKAVILQTNDGNAKIMRVINKNEIDSVLAAVKNKTQIPASATPGDGAGETSVAT